MQQLTVGVALLDDALHELLVAAARLAQPVDFHQRLFQRLLDVSRLCVHRLSRKQFLVYSRLVQMSHYRWKYSRIRLYHPTRTGPKWLI